MPNRWVTAALILTVLSLLGSAIVISQVAQNTGGGSGEISATCPVRQYATGENKSGSFLCGSASNTNYVSTTSCPNPQFLQNSSNCNTVPLPYTYIINNSNGVITAYPTINSFPEYSSSDCSIVLNSVSNYFNGLSVKTLHAVFMKSGIYNCKDQIDLKNLTQIYGSGIGSNISGVGSFPSTVLINTNHSLTYTIKESGGLSNVMIYGCPTSYVVNVLKAQTTFNNLFIDAKVHHDACSSTTQSAIVLNSRYNLIDNLFVKDANIGVDINATFGNIISNFNCGGSENPVTTCVKLEKGLSEANVFMGCVIPSNIPSNCNAVDDATSLNGNYACPTINVNSDLFCVSWAQIALYPPNCPANQFVIGVTTTLSCSAQSAVSTEQAAGCPGAQQFVTTESANGNLGCSIVTYGTCPVNQFATAITTTTLNCGAQLAVTTEAAAGCPANQFVTTESANGSFSCGAVSTEAIASCSTGQFATSENAAGSFSCGNPNIQFVTNSSTCTDTTATTALMAGLGVSYTPNGTGKVSVTLNFKITTPATSTINTQWQLAFGTGKEPVCNAAATGTTVGQKFEQGTWAAVASFVSPSVTAGVFNLTPGTRYWFDLQMTDSTGASWTYSLPQLTVVES